MDLNNGTNAEVQQDWSFGEQQAAALIILVITMVGASCNWFIALTINKLANLKNSFGRLVASQALADAIHSTIFIFYYCPMVFLNIESWQPQFVSKRFGHILLICYDICIYSHVFISLNRLAAIVFPFTYNKLFSPAFTNAYIGIAWALSILPSFYLNVFLDCTTLYMDAFWAFGFVPECMYVVKIAFVKYIAIVLFIAAVDFVTLCRVRSLRVGHEEHVSSAIKRNKELSFFKQAIFQAAVFTLELFTYFYFFLMFESRWYRFSCTTLAWVLVHAIDGVVVICFNTEFQLHFSKIMKKNLGKYTTTTGDLTSNLTHTQRTSNLSN